MKPGIQNVMIRSSYFLEVSRKLPHTNMQFSEHQLDIWEFNLILLISETVYLKIASDSIGKALQVICPGFWNELRTLGCQSEVSKISLSDWVNLIEQFAIEHIYSEGWEQLSGRDAEGRTQGKEIPFLPNHVSMIWILSISPFFSFLWRIHYRHDWSTLFIYLKALNLSYLADILSCWTCIG